MARCFLVAVSPRDDLGVPRLGGHAVVAEELGSCWPVPAVSFVAHIAQCALRLAIAGADASPTAARNRAGRPVALLLAARALRTKQASRRQPGRGEAKVILGNRN